MQKELTEEEKIEIELENRRNLKRLSNIELLTLFDSDQVSESFRRVVEDTLKKRNVNV